MISVLIWNGSKKEDDRFLACFKDLVAHVSEERLVWEEIRDSAGLRAALDHLSVIHMAIFDVTLSGALEGAAALRARSPQTEILIVADLSISPMAYMNPAIKASSLLLRPFPAKLLESTCKGFLLNCPAVSGAGEGEKSFLVENSDGKTLVPYSSILYFEAREKKIFVRTAAQEYGVYETMDHLQERLPQTFLRCHRSYIVNKAMIDRVRFSENTIYLDKGLCLPLSRTYKSALKEYLSGNESA